MTGQTHTLCYLFSSFLAIALILAIIVIIYLLRAVHESSYDRTSYSTPDPLSSTE